jgi:hypothetical protein
MRIDSANYTSFSSQPDGGGVVTTLTNIANSVSDRINSDSDSGNGGDVDSRGLMIGFTTLLKNLCIEMIGDLPKNSTTARESIDAIDNQIAKDEESGVNGLPSISSLMQNVINSFSNATNSEYEAAVQTTISQLSMGGAVTVGMLNFFLCLPEIQNNSTVSANIETCINLIQAGQSQIDTTSQLYKNLDELSHYRNIE